ncbi:hypothetical protein CI109_103591 [Kwoniella shandongensis]|uniref:Uncharacterized protein n=1 Tax=Kwoniella shandongensis TaxID=1734106 RepID=A0A5M6CCI5_9TREE|nr:uncharacterized protein CI109_000717 [Kwoniella shandongensis]KAA5531145.1 hypothetical protein CI109_000717 [Kwoniella shandongensis]
MPRAGINYVSSTLNRTKRQYRQSKRSRATRPSPKPLFSYLDPSFDPPRDTSGSSSRSDSPSTSDHKNMKVASVGSAEERNRDENHEAEEGDSVVQTKTQSRPSGKKMKRKKKDLEWEFSFAREDFALSSNEEVRMEMREAKRKEEEKKPWFIRWQVDRTALGLDMEEREESARIGRVQDQRPDHNSNFCSSLNHRHIRTSPPTNGYCFLISSQGAVNSKTYQLAA